MRESAMRLLRSHLNLSDLILEVRGSWFHLCKHIWVAGFQTSQRHDLYEEIPGKTREYLGGAPTKCCPGEKSNQEHLSIQR